MARLKHTQTGRTVTLGASTLFGRSSASTVVLEHRKASGRHATLAYSSGHWTLRDLGSRNGTALNGTALASGGRITVDAGARIEFAGDPWELIDAGPPVPVAERDDGLRRAAADGLLPLPDDDDPEVTVYGASGRWIAEQDGEPRRVKDGDALLIDGHRWVLQLPPPTPGGGTLTTLGPDDGVRSLATLTRLTLAVSRDEETVQVSLSFLGDPVPLPPRSFGYLLVVLARAREGDADEPPPEQGWMYADDVCREVGVDPERLNVEIYRCRKLLAKMGIDGAAELFERRPHTRQVRLGVDCAEIVPLS